MDDNKQDFDLTQKSTQEIAAEAVKEIVEESTDIEWQRLLQDRVGLALSVTMSLGGDLHDNFDYITAIIDGDYEPEEPEIGPSGGNVVKIH